MMMGVGRAVGRAGSGACRRGAKYLNHYVNPGFSGSASADQALTLIPESAPVGQVFDAEDPGSILHVEESPDEGGMVNAWTRSLSGTASWRLPEIFEALIRDTVLSMCR